MAYLGFGEWGDGQGGRCHGGCVHKWRQMNKVLAAVAAANDAYRAELLPYLFQHLQTCRPKDVPQHAEAIVRSVEAAHADAFVAVLVRRLAVMNATQAARLRRVILQVEASTGRHRVQQPSLAARPRRLCL